MVPGNECPGCGAIYSKVEAALKKQERDLQEEKQKLTEKHEKAARTGIMRAQGCSEFEAVYVVAECIAKSRGT